MLLIRLDKSVTSDPENPQDYAQREFGFKKIEDRDKEMSRVRIDYPDFGRGPQRRPGFAVEVDWIDVRSYLAAFIEMEHPEALYIKRLITLAKAIEDAGWSPDDPPTVEFGDAVLDAVSP